MAEINMTNVTEVKTLLKDFDELWTKVSTTPNGAYSFKLSSIAKKLVAMDLSDEFKKQYLSEEEQHLLDDKVSVISRLR